MTVSLNHTIVVARDKAASAAFLTEMLGLPPSRMLGHFAVVQVGATSLDFVETDGEIAQRHFAFLVSEAEFDAIFERSREPGRINRWDDGRGLYFDDPNGHLLEIITRPYGSGGPHAAHPNPLLSMT
jgi:catechol 2,3-dioxygenase-like lactoylglutathione lyase family enzyme